MTTFSEYSFGLVLGQNSRGQNGKGQNGRGQNGTDKMAPIESSINQAIQLPLTI